MKFDFQTDKNKFIEDNLGLVVTIVKEVNRGMINDDLFQVGSLALVKATESFDNTIGKKFSNYASKYIKGDILKYIRYDSIIKPLQERGKWNFLYKDVVSFDDRTGQGEETYVDTICGYDNLEEDVINRMIIKLFFDGLSERDKIIINLKMDGMEQKNISKIVCINQSNVSRVINRGRKQYEELSSI